MGVIPENMLPPKDLWPEYTAPEEFADTPDELNLTDFLVDRHVREGRGDNPAIKFMDQTVTYSQLQQSANKFGNALKEVGVEAQDRVGIRLVNSIQAVVAIFAIEKIGAIPVPTSPLWSGEEVAFVANNAEMKLFIVNAPLMPPVETAMVTSPRRRYEGTMKSEWSASSTTLTRTRLVRASLATARLAVRSSVVAMTRKASCKSPA